MSMNVNQDYSQFYAGTEQIKSYGSNPVAKKDTLVKYWFNTTDEHGNKVMDKMTKEETMKAMNDISSQYGDSIIVQFSGDGLAALAEGGKFMSGKGMTVEEAAARAARDAAFQAENVTQLENTHRIVIPNYEKNERLYNSLAGADDNVISSTMGIISNYLMPGDASGLLEQERAAFGLEAARYLAENYLDESHAADFMSAMETIAKYGLNSSVSDSGKVIYNVQEGQVRMSGAPSSYVDMESWLKANDTDLYDQINELNQSIINHKDGENHSAKFIELYTKAAKEILNAPDDTKADKDYAAWKENVEKTEIPATFQNVRYNNFQSFLESLQNQSSLSDTWISENIQRFMKWLTDKNIPTPTGKETWRHRTVENILSNEKYKGDARLQKCYTVDFLSKKRKANEGEVPQYYVEGSHDAIIEPAEWQLVQIEMKRRKDTGRSHNCCSPFSAKLKCGGCGEYFGSKVWHSNSKYKRTVWQCNAKFKGESRCTTPHLYEQRIKELFLEALGILMADRETVIADCRAVMKALADCGPIDAEMEAVSDEMEVTAGLIQKLVDENATRKLDQHDYRKKYDGYASRYAALESRMDSLEKEREKKEIQYDLFDGFLAGLGETEVLPVDFSGKLFHRLVDHATVHSDCRVVFTFRNGAEVSTEI